ncbi:MAG: Peptidase, M23/M37 family [candidate division WWE3 bacterium GW2011_GWC1_41_7]|uniref:Peptidase, M23/M37 family n=2 Tax=Katanobacteria TaxID=422282 RepID=A0A0G1A7E9_UNCKA|nr:MAG: Peptidase, M23/M37 family [candidate division WWE3 bacterium GW2011_GWB1_41_6]KKS21218.1 MAG: Peptidase, M23/M37 family [candidate division WWE3 bacterium GW2011_GWC1_41_7]
MIPVLAAVILAVLIVLGAGLVRADSCDDIADLDDRAECYAEQIEKKEQQYQSASKKLSSIKDKANGVAQKIAQLSGQLNVTQSEVRELESDIAQMEEELDVLDKNIEDRQQKLGEKIALRNKVVRNYSKRGVLNDLEIFLSVLPSHNLNGFQFSAFSYIFEKSLTSETISLIGSINTEISNFERDKKEAEELKSDLEKAKSDLLALRTQLANQKAGEENVLGDLKDEESNLEGKLSELSKDISELSSKQQSILAQKAGEGFGTVGDYEAESQKLPDPGFSPAFALGSYGAYTHRRGMSQYGAKARAEGGQKHDAIIKFYYKQSVVKKDGFPDEIKVDGYGNMDFQKYLYGIAEMPDSWHEEALKAQAIAARTYAYRYYKAGKSICTSQSCQVFLKSKSDSPPSRWKKAVDDTKGKIIDGDTHAMYSSTTGGFILDGVGWDTSGKWPGDAYEKKAKSPWFFKAWYKQTYNESSSTCGRSSPWLNEKEMADILNAWVVYERGSNSEVDRISPVTTSCWGGNPYSLDDMASKAEKYGTKFTSVRYEKVDISNGGYTSNVVFNTNQGRVEIDGTEFKRVFNLRAPGYISIRNALYDFIIK